jgi:DNA processing protein
MHVPPRWSAGSGAVRDLGRALGARGGAGLVCEGPGQTLRALARGTPEYPAALLDLSDPPAFLYTRGVVPPQVRCVALVGSRAASQYGLAQAHRLARDLVGLGFAVVSGLARGIDAAAHRGALDGDGITVAVLPGGLDAIVPGHHAALAESIAIRGALVSERASGAPPGRGVFVTRNRLVAALSAAVVVVEAAERSGALTTAAAARRLGRPVLAVPGDVDRETSRGVHELIRRGARLCAHAGDVIEALGATEPLPKRSTAAPARFYPPAPPAEGAPQARLLGALEARPLGVEALAARAGLSPGEALAALLVLEWSGVAVAFPGQRWARSAGLA